MGFFGNMYKSVASLAYGIMSIPATFLYYMFVFPAQKVGLLGPSEDPLRAPLVTDPNVEDAIYFDPEKALTKYRGTYGKIFRYVTSGGKVTNVITDKGFAEQMLKTRAVSFYAASQQSKIRFGLKEAVKDEASVSRLSNYFRKAFMGSKVMEGFEQPLVDHITRRTKEFLVGQGSPKEFKTFGLSDLAGQVTLAASVDAVFGRENGIYSPSFYADYMTFREAIGRRSAPMDGNKVEQLAYLNDVKAVKEAKLRLMKVLAKSRDPNGDAAPCIKNMRSMLTISDDEADYISLHLVWGANINSHPSSMWVISRLLQDPSILNALIAEKEELHKSNPKISVVDSIKERPLLNAVVAESLRLNSRPNMYRVMIDDCTIKCPVIPGQPAKEMKVKKNEWVWMFPRFYLHHNHEEFDEPEKFKPFERFAPGEGGNSPDYCPFRAGVLRVFGGGTVPCPGKDYAVFLFKAVVDVVLLSGLMDLRLLDPEKPLPAPAKMTVASTPPPSEEIYAQVKAC